MWAVRAAGARKDGVASLVDGLLKIWFTPQSIADDTAAVRYVRSALQRSPGEGYALACEALAAADLRPLAAKIAAPTLVVCGDDDIPSFLDAARWLDRQHPRRAAGMDRQGQARLGDRASRPGARAAARLPFREKLISAQVLVEEIERQRQRAVGFRLAVGLAAEAREGVVGAGIFVDRHQRIGRQPPLQQLVDLRLHPAVLHRHVQHERPVQVLRLADVVLDIGAVIGDRAIDVGAAAHQVAELAAEAVADRADLAVALRQLLQEVPGVLHVAHAEVVVEIVIEIERLLARRRDCWSDSSTPGSCRQNRSGTRQTKPASANSCAWWRMVSLTPQISMMAMIAPAGVRSGMAR